MNYILNVEPDFVYAKHADILFPLEKNHLYTNLEINQILKYAVYKCREKLADECNVVRDPLINKCDFAQSYIGYILESLNIYCIPNTTKTTMSKTVDYHAFLTVCFNTIDGVKNYLVDITYRQFFLIENCTEDNYVIVNNKVVIAPNPGYFVQRDKEKVKMAFNLLFSGYIPLTPTNAKLYGDSFVLGQTGVVANLMTNESNISGNDYLISFLKNKSSYSYTVDELFDNEKGDSTILSR